MAISGLDANSDGQIQCSEAAAYFGPIDVHALGINDLTGIEAFVNINSLTCYNNNLTSLNVSANTSLVYLHCAQNHITSLDVSANTALTSLFCENNAFTSLNFSNNTNLVNLICANNTLSTLILPSSAPNLALFNCVNDNLTGTLDLSAYPTLTNILCYENQLTTLNVTSLTQLNYLNCGHNQLTSLDLSSQSQLTFLDLSFNLISSVSVSANVGLINLYVQNNALTSIDLSGLIALVQFNGDNNTLTALNVSASKGLQYLSCGNNSIATLDVSGLGSLVQLYCYGNQLTSLNVKNGNNVNFTIFNATGNPPLTCIQVDDPNFMIANWSGGKDPGASFSTNCTPPCFPTPPAVTSNGPTAFCEGASVVLDAGNYLSYSWSSSETTETITVSSSGTYTVTVVNNIGCSAAASQTVIVNPLPTVNAITNQTVCANTLTSAVNFTGFVAGTIYKWTNSNTTIGLASSGVGTIDTFTALNNGNAAVTSTITATPLEAGYAYIATSDNTVSVIDRSTQAVVATIPVGTAPQSVAASAGGNRVYVSNFFDNTVSVINTSTNTVIATVPVGFHPCNIVVNTGGQNIYVANQGNNTVSVISNSDFNTYSVTATITVGAAPFGIAISPVGNTLYVANYDGNTISVINTSNNTVTATISDPNFSQPKEMVVSQDGSRLYVANYNGNNYLSVINTANNLVIANYTGIGGGPQGVAVSPDGSLVYIARGGYDDVVVLSTNDGSLVADISAGGNTIGLSLSPDGNELYVTNLDDGTVSVMNTIDPNNIYVTNTIPVGNGPWSYGNFISTSGCIGTPTTFTITVNPTPQPSITPPGPITICNGGAVTLDAGTYELYQWNDQENTETINPSSGGTYTVTVIDGNGCSGTASQTVNTNPAFSTGLSSTVPVCYGQPFNVTVTGNGGTLPYTGTGTFIVPGFASADTSITFLIIDSVGCVSYDSVLVFQPAAITPNSVFPQNINCYGDASGQIHFAQANGGTPFTNFTAYPNRYAFTLIGADSVYYNTSGTFTGLTAGSYLETVTDSLGCGYSNIAGVTVVLTQPAQSLTATVPGDSVVICLDNNDSTANVMLTITGGTPPYAITGADTTNLRPGLYSYLITDASGCSTTLNNVSVVNVQHCILPYYVPPDSGRVDSIIGPELTQLVSHPDSIGGTTNNVIFQTDLGSVLIEVIANVGYHDSLLTLLLSPAYGMTDTISNGDTTQIITGTFPVANLTKLNSLTTLVDYVRPYYPPVGNNAINGLAYSLGDVAERSNSARSAFNIDGTGVKVGVISDSYNTLAGNPAQRDVNNGDLPGLAGGYNPNPVEVLQEYPFGRGTDEGRAMLQIVHDVAPKAKLAFWSGNISAGNMALGIRQLQQDSVDVIVDDITYITEPFFKDGVIAQAVNYVSCRGVSYFSSAGNFGNESYEGVFNDAPNPGWAKATSMILVVVTFIKT